MESLTVQRKEGMWRKERMGESAWFVKTKSEINFFFFKSSGGFERTKTQQVQPARVRTTGGSMKQCSNCQNYIRTSPYRVYHSAGTSS